MAGLLQNFRLTLLVSLALAAVMIAGYAAHSPGGVTGDPFWQALLRWSHVLVGVLWVGLLYYFNFVQIRVMPAIPVELKPAVTRYIAPEALFWFRWAAALTVLTGLVLAWVRGYFLEALTLGQAGGFEAESDTGAAFIGFGMWLAILMAINVWVFIWPNQKVALGLIDAEPDAKAKAGRTAMLFSRTNLLLSLPMLVAMTMNQTLFG